MNLVLADDTHPVGLSVRVYGWHDRNGHRGCIHIGDYIFTMDDFLWTALKVTGNIKEKWDIIDRNKNTSIEVKSAGWREYGIHSAPSSVHLGDYRLSVKNFLDAVKYLIGYTNLVDGDPRIPFIESLKLLQKKMCC